jgi:tRNA(Ile)-lysidine synthase
MHHDSSRVVLSAARRAARTADRPLLLAVSGGLDSMALLSAMTAVARRRIAAVATFDHGTGAAASRAARRVCQTAAAAGLPVVIGQIKADLIVSEGREAAWREDRHRFLGETAASLGARVVTAHTEDDQIETVLMRIMRGSGARGLAGLYAAGPILRPFVEVRHAVLKEYLLAAGVDWVDDPSNVSTEFMRNRARLELLPALRRAEPSLESGILSVARRADALRRDVDTFVSVVLKPAMCPNGRLMVASEQLTGYDEDSLAVLWVALAGRAGLALDRRGTERLAAFTNSRPRSGRIPLAGGWFLEASRDTYILYKPLSLQPSPAARLPVQDGGALDWGRFRFRVCKAAVPSSLWTASIVGSAGGTVRSWSAGDRLEPAAGQSRRRVTRYLSDVGVRGTDRVGWPVVVAGDDIVWIPGVRRSDAATDRSGRPVRHYVCERIDR